MSDSDAIKHREYWVELIPESQPPHTAWTEGHLSVEVYPERMVHVIEYSAYEQAVKARDESNEIIHEVTTENFRLKAALIKISKMDPDDAEHFAGSVADEALSR